MAVALPLIAIAATVAGTAVATVAAVKQGDAASDAAKFNAKQAEQNAQVATGQATEDERAFRVFSRQQLGAIQAGYGASGVQNVGSAEDVLESGAQQSEMDALKIRYGGQLKAKGYEDSASLSGMEASSASAGGYLSAAGTLLSGASKAAYYGLPAKGSGYSGGGPY